MKEVPCKKPERPERKGGRCHRPPSRFFLLAYLFSGLGALLWFLIRVIPKPSRAAYPCQRLAFPLASSFVLWVAGLTGSIAAFRKARQFFLSARYVLACLCGAAAVSLLLWALSLPGEQATAAWNPSDPPNTPIGVGKGIHPGRVVWVYEPAATNWDGTSRYWWSETFTDQAVVDGAMSEGIRRLTGESSDAQAWDALFRSFNQSHGRGERGYQSGEEIAIKINMNVAGDYALTNEPIVSPQVVLALLRQLVNEAQVPAGSICVYDASRCITSAIYSPCRSEFPEVRFYDKQGQQGMIRVTAATTGAIHYADSSVPYSGRTRIPRCVARASYLINLALLRGHSLAGVTLCAKNHFGSVQQPNGNWSPSHMHDSIDRNKPMRTPNALVDLMGHKDLGGKTLLFLIDALYAAVNQGASTPTRWRMDPFNNDWTSSLFLSQDGVAIDSVALDFCRSEPNLSSQVRGSSVDNYLHEAALAGNPPSGAFYDPEGDGTRLESLGVHEHWNNATAKQYSRNLGTGEGIELVAVPGLGGFKRGDVNADGRLDVSDAVTALTYLFMGREVPCVASADVNDSAHVDVADAVSLLSYLFAGAAPPEPPFESCGADPTPDELPCDSFPPCSPPTLSGRWVKLLTAQNEATFFVPRDGSLGLSWTEVDFDDSTWQRGTGACGYDRNDDYRSHFTTDVGQWMDGIHASLYLRIPFTLEELPPVLRLILQVKYDDGFVAYLNGAQLPVSRNAPPDPAWDSEATVSHSDFQAVIFEPCDITRSKDLLRVGTNVLALHGLNTSVRSSDFLLAVELEALVPEE